MLISYGERNNDDLLLNFGFVEDNNLFDVYQICNIENKLRIPAINNSPSSTLTLRPDLQTSLLDFKVNVKMICNKDIDEKEAKEELLFVISSEKFRIKEFLASGIHETEPIIKEFLESKMNILDTIEMKIKL